MTGQRFIVIDNLADIAAAYGESAAGRVLAGVAQRLEAGLGLGTSDLTIFEWGVGLTVPLLANGGGSNAFISRLVAQVECASYSVPQGEIVAALVVQSVMPSGEARLSRAAHLSTQEFRVAMSAAAIAYRALAHGRLRLIEQRVASTSLEESDLYHECLSRIEGEEGQVVLPSAYIGALEELGLSAAFDRCVLEATIDLLRARPAAALGCNISGASAALDDWWWHVFPSLVADPELASRLVIEITESQRPYNLSSATAFVDHLRRLGCRLALDDFGAGFSSIGLARDAQFDIIKIDGSYVRNKIAAEYSESLLQHLVDLAGAVTSHVVIEGIESEEDRQLAISTGAKWVQGYFLGAPAFPAPRPKSHEARVRS